MPLISSGAGNTARWAWAQGWSHLRRSRGSVAAIAGTAGCCLLLQLVLLMLIGSQRSFHELQTRTALQLEVLPGATDQDISALYAALRQHPAVEDVQYATRAQVYEAQRTKDPDFIAFLEKFKLDNPFPDTLSVIVRSVDDYAVLEEFLREDTWHRVVDPQFLTHAAAAESDVRAMLGILHWARYTLAFFLAVGFLALAAVVGRAVGGNRNSDVAALLGAHMGQMLAPPFVAAGVLLLIGTLSSALVAGIGGIVLLGLLPGDAAGAFLHDQLFPILAESAPQLLLLELFVILPVALVGAAVAAQTTIPAPSILQWGKLPVPKRA